MKKNTFYLIFGCIALALLVIFWYSVELHTPLLIEIAFIIGIVLVYLAQRKVTDIIEDERDVKITEQATPGQCRSSGLSSAHFPSGLSCRSSMSRHFPARHQDASARYPWPANDGICPAGPALPDDLPVCRFQDLLCEKIRGF